MDAKRIMELRSMTGAGVLDAKRALEESGGDLRVAAEALRKKEHANATSRAERETHEGLVGAYVHATGKVGALVEVACETDFVARSEEFQSLVHDLAMHVAASNPRYLTVEEVPPDAFAAETCLLAQAFVKDEDVTVAERVQQAIAKTGENIQIRRFCRFAL